MEDSGEKLGLSDALDEKEQAPLHAMRLRCRAQQTAWQIDELAVTAVVGSPQTQIMYVESGNTAETEILSLRR